MDAIDPLTAWYLIAAAHDAMTPLIATTSSLYPPPPPPAPAPSDPHPPGKDAPHATVRNLFYVATGRMCNHKESVACGIVIADEFYRRYGAAAPKDHSPPGRRRVYPSVDHPWITDKLRALDSQFG